MPRLIVQIDSSVASDDFAWLAQALPPKLAPLGLDAEVYVSPQIMPQPSGPLSTFEVFEFAQHRINHSGLRQSAEQLGKWYIHLFITTSHVVEDYLGLMYDSGFDDLPRQGCAVFWKPIKALCPTSTDFRAVMLRTSLHEIGHCLNLNHNWDGSVMTQTEQLIGPGWLRHISYHFAQIDRERLRDFPNDCKPGYGSSSGVAADLLTADVPLSLKVEPFDKEDLVIGDSLSVLLRIENKGVSELKVSHPLDPTASNLKIWLTSPDGKEKPIQKMILLCGKAAQTLTIGGGTSQVVPLHLFADRNGYLFPNSGTYGLKIALRIKADRWMSSQMAFQVSPVSEGKQTPYVLYSPKVLRFISLNGTESKETKRYVLELIKGDPLSVTSRALLWNLVYQTVTKLAQASEKQQVKLQRELLKYYRQLAVNETSALKKGKVLLEIARLSTFLGKNIAKKYADKQGLIESYKLFSKNQIKRPKTY